MFTVTFYSYKGGVGRTLALVNVAYTLATEGGKARVVMLDFDLEAPGLDTIVTFAGGRGADKGGVVEYIAEYGNNPEPNPESLPSLLPYVREVDGIPNLMVIPAGKKDDEYQKALTCLDWQSFYRVKQGYRFFEQFKRKIDEELKPDYLLVDSRTGLADVAGITTHQLADLVVLVFNLNRQNLDGIKRCYHSIVSAPKQRPIQVLLVASPVPQRQLLDPGLLESRLDEAADSMPVVVNYSRTGKDPIIQIPYHPILSLRDDVFVQRYPTDEISGIYRRIVEAVRKSNPAEMKFLLVRAYRYWDDNRFEEAEEEFRAVIKQHPGNAEGLYLYGDFLMKRERYKEAIAPLEEANRVVDNNALYLSALGMALARENRTDAALDKLKRAETLGSKDEAVLQGISRLYDKMGDSTKALEYWRKISQVKPPATRLGRVLPRERFVAMAPEFLDPSLNVPKDFDRKGFVDRLEKALTFDYATKASLLESALKRDLSPQQIQELDELLKRQEEQLAEDLGDYFATVQSKVRQGELHHWLHEGDLERLVKQEQGAGGNAFRLCLAVGKMYNEKYREAANIIEAAVKTPIADPGEGLLYRLGGDAILELARQTEDKPRKEELLREAAGKYSKADEIRPDDDWLLNNWGIVLGMLSDLREGGEREALLKEAMEKCARALEIKPDQHEVLNNWGVVLMDVSALHEGAEREALLQEAIEKYVRALEIKPDQHEALHNWANALGRLSDLREGGEREALLQEAIEKFAKALEIKPDQHDPLNNWGSTLLRISALHEGAEREALLQEAIEKYTKALEIKPDKHDALYNWGNALGMLSVLREGAERESLLQEAIEKFARALEIKPDQYDALYRWANALRRLSDLREEAEREALLQEAIEKFARAIEIKPDQHDALYRWANALRRLSDLREGAERESLLKEAIEKFARAIEIKPDQHEILNNWGATLLNLSYLQAGGKRIETIEAALEKAQRAEELKQGTGIYNIACCQALLGKKKLALSALKKAVEHDSRCKEMAAKDEDFRSLWEDKAFKAIVAA